MVQNVKKPKLDILGVEHCKKIDDLLGVKLMSQNCGQF